jgi:hypothetical protein
MTRILSGALIVLFVLCLSLIGLSKHLYEDNSKLATELSNAVEINKHMQESLVISEKRCEIDISISKELIEEKKVIESETEKKIDKISSLNITKQKKEEVVNEKKDYVDLDAILPPELTSLLDESCSAARGSSCVSP